ncbi:MAG: hypothetical protein WC322_03365 [Candidatus Paceibacterota bacterium]|jgi:hypothetical protein
MTDQSRGDTEKTIARKDRIIYLLAMQLNSLKTTATEWIAWAESEVDKDED